MQFSTLDVLNHAIKICKEKEYLALQEKLHRSYIELMAVEANTRREKVSEIIKSMQIFDRELKLLKFEYVRVKEKFNIKNISAIDKYISEIEQIRKRLSLEKSLIK